MTTDHEPACVEVIERLTAYLDDALPAAERARIDDHLSECDGCSVYLDQIRATIAAMGALEDTPLSAQAWARLHEAFRERPRAGS